MKKIIFIIYLILINLILISNAYSTEINTKYFKLKLMENPALLEKKEQPDFIYYQYKTNKYFLKIIIAKKAQIDYRKVKLLKNKTFYTKNNISAYHIIYKSLDKINDSLYTYYDRYFYYIIFQVNPEKYNEYKDIFNSYINNIEIYSVKQNKNNIYTKKIDINTNNLSNLNNNNFNNPYIYTDPLNTFTVRTDNNWEGPKLGNTNESTVYTWGIEEGKYAFGLSQTKITKKITYEEEKVFNITLVYYISKKLNWEVKNMERINIKGQDTAIAYAKNGELYVLMTVLHTNKYAYTIMLGSIYNYPDKQEFLNYINRVNFLK